MPIKMTNVAGIMASIRQKTERLSNESMHYWLSWAGEQLRNTALETRTFEDQTGNLASSIGYVLVHDGKIVGKATPNKVKDGDEGVREGQAYLDNLAEKYGRIGWVLIVSAGMDYAAYVEASGRVVLSSAELKAPAIIADALKGALREAGIMK